MNHLTESTSQPLRQPLALSPKGLNVLLVDDHEELRAMTAELLESMGLVVWTAASGEEALTSFTRATRPIDLVVTDLEMPDMGGAELLDRLAERGVVLRVIANSSNDEAPVRRRVARGEVVFLRKPFAAADLAAAVQTMLARPATVLSAAPRSAGSAPGARLSVWWVAAALIVLALGVGQFLRLAAPPLPSPIPGVTTRGGGIVIVEPRGELAAMPSELVWQAIDGASEYRASVRGVDDAVLWETAVRTPRLSLPAEVAAELHPAVVYFWSVAAVDAAGAEVARSRTVGFRVAAGP